MPGGQDLGHDDAEPGPGPADLTGELAGPAWAPGRRPLAFPQDHPAFEVTDPDDLPDVRPALAQRGDRDQVGGEAALEFLAEQVLAGDAFLLP